MPSGTSSDLGLARAGPALEVARAASARSSSGDAVVAAAASVLVERVVDRPLVVLLRVDLRLALGRALDRVVEPA